MLIARTHDENPLTFGLTGSCRVFNSVKPLLANAHAEKFWFGANAFTHAPLETEQYIRYCLGELYVPRELLFYILGTENLLPRDKSFNTVWEGVDILICEISSSWYITFGQYALQATYFMQSFVRGGGPLFLDWWRQVSRNGAAPIDLVDRICAESKLGEDSPERRLLHDARYHQYDAEGMAAHLRRLKSYGKRVLVVGPVNIALPGEEGHRTDRAKLIDLLGEAAPAAGVGYFDPGPLARSLGKEIVFHDGGRDQFHYSEQFMGHLGKAMMDAAKR